MAKQRSKIAGTVRLTPRLVEERRKQFEAGDQGALLDALDLCLRSGVRVPGWLVNVFCDRYLDWLLFRAGTLDDAFRVKRPKGMQLKRRASREALKPRVVIEVIRLRRLGLKKDETLFKKVGKVLNIRRSLASQIYYDKANHWRKFLEAVVTDKTEI